MRRFNGDVGNARIWLPIWIVHPPPFVKLKKLYGGCDVTMKSYQKILAPPKHGMQVDLTDSYTLLYTCTWTCACSYL